jgi:hypothetical protein
MESAASFSRGVDNGDDCAWALVQPLKIGEALTVALLQG